MSLGEQLVWAAAYAQKQSTDRYYREAPEDFSIRCAVWASHVVMAMRSSFEHAVKNERLAVPMEHLRQMTYKAENR